MTIDGKNLYVTEQVNSVESRTDVFDTTTRAFVRQFDLPVNPPIESAFQGIGVGHATGSTQAYVGAAERIGGEPYGVVVPFDAEGHQLGHPWTGEDTPAGAFSGQLATFGGEPAVEGTLVDVAVDNDSTGLLGDWAAGDVFVVTQSTHSVFPALNVIDVFKPEAAGTEKYQTQLTGTCESPGVCPGKVILFHRPRKIVVDPRNGDLLVVDEGEDNHNVVDMFRPGPVVDEYEFVGSVKESPRGAFGTIQAIAIDGGEGLFAEGEFYIVEQAGVVYQFNSAGQYVGRFLAPTTSSAVVDPVTHDVYLGSPGGEEGQVEIFGPSLLLPDVTTVPVSNLAPKSATLNGTVNPDKAGAGETTCQFVWGTSESFGHVLPCPTPVTEGESPVPVSTDLEGLEPGTTYYYRLRASNPNGTNEGEASQTQHFTTPGPHLLEESAFGISSTSATLGALIDPHGASTTYYFQYGTTSAYGSDTPAAPGDLIGAGESNVEVTRRLQGLSPSTVYHYRVVTVSQLEVEPGVVRTSAFDGRDQTFTTQSTGGSLVLPDGRAWEQVSPIDKDGAIISRPSRNIGVVEASASGDALAYASSTPTEAEAPGYAEGEQILSQRRSGGWSTQDIGLPHRSSTGLVVGHGGDYRFFSEDLSLGLAEPIGPFTSLAPEATPLDTERTPYLRHDDTCRAQPSTCYLPLVTGAPGYADVPEDTVFDSEPESHVSGVEFVGASSDLSHVLLASSVALTAEPISGRGLYEWSAGKSPAEELQLIGEKLPNGFAISEDGARVVYKTATGDLYQRNTTNGRTVQLDEVQPGASGLGQASAYFAGENRNGSVIYFIDGQELTKDSGARPGAADLYECAISEVGGEDKCDLTDITPKAGGQRANVGGWVFGVSKDGSYVYFVATGVLTNRPSSEGEEAVAGAPNLYEYHDGALRLVAVLSQDDNRNPSRVSPGGRYLAFMSGRSLTGYDNIDISSGRPDQEVYLFDSSDDRLVCSSCDPSGARPEGESLNQAANLPNLTTYTEGESLYQPRYLSDSGRLFFESSDALVPQDINKNEDVYEYEPVGVGGCSASSPKYDVPADGCLGLISSGTARGESTFLDASANGDDVFFLTSERLVAGDVDSAVDVYDAQVCSTAVPCPSVVSSPPPCTTADSCRSAPLPQPAIFGSPASATFAGAGNVTSAPSQAPKPKSLTRAQKLARALKICRREAKRKRATCERKARKQYSSKPAHRARVTKGGRG